MKKTRCPTCGRSFDIEKSTSLPFCSLRCRQVDMGRWLEEVHAIPEDPEAAAEVEDAGLDDSEQQEP